MARSYASGLSYSVARPYPFRFFSIYVLVGGILATALFSFLNYASSGYVLVSEYRYDPNATETRSSISKLPSWLTTKYRPTCQPANLPVGSSLSTNNTALRYTLRSVYEQRDPEKSLASLVYHNNMFNNCTINNIQLNIESIDRNAAQIAVVAFGVDLFATMTCSIDNPDSGPVVFDMTADYNLVHDTVGIGTRDSRSNTNVGSNLYAFTGRNTSTKASLWWGESLLSMHSGYLSSQISSNQSWIVWGDNAYTKGTIYLNTDDDLLDDITSDGFFHVFYRFNNVASNGQLMTTPQTSEQKIADLINKAELGEQDGGDGGLRPMPIWRSVDSLAKSFHSIILTDLGQTSYEGQNILTSPDLLTHFTADFDHINETNINRDALVYMRGLAQGPFNSTSSTQTGPLGVNPSVFSTVYLCQIPRLKGTADLLLTIFVGDLVLLNGLWVIVIFVATTIAERKDPKAAWCAGCLEKDGMLIGLGDRSPPRKQPHVSYESLGSMDRSRRSIDST